MSHDETNVTETVTLSASADIVQHIGERRHDPLCPTEQCCAKDERATREFCQCDLIARVREDERQRFDDDGAEWDIRAAVVRDAVAAIYRTCGHTKYAGCSPCAHDDAVAAIEALGGER